MAAGEDRPSLGIEAVNVSQRIERPSFCKANWVEQEIAGGWNEKHNTVASWRRRL